MDASKGSCNITMLTSYINSTTGTVETSSEKAMEKKGVNKGKAYKDRYEVAQVLYPLASSPDTSDLSRIEKLQHKYTIYKLSFPAGFLCSLLIFCKKKTMLKPIKVFLDLKSKQQRVVHTYTYIERDL